MLRKILILGSEKDRNEYITKLRLETGNRQSDMESSIGLAPYRIRINNELVNVWNVPALNARYLQGADAIINVSGSEGKKIANQETVNVRVEDYALSDENTPSVSLSRLVSQLPKKTIGYRPVSPLYRTPEVDTEQQGMIEMKPISRQFV